jgi:hypothetical protein
MQRLLVVVIQEHGQQSQSLLRLAQLVDQGLEALHPLDLQAVAVTQARLQ